MLTSNPLEANITPHPQRRAGQQVASRIGQQRQLAAITAAMLVFSGVFGLTGSESAAETGDSAFSRLYFGLQPPTSRAAERDVNLIEELLEAGRFGESAPLVVRRFAAIEDHVDSTGVSLKGRLLRSLLRCEPSGLKTLRSVLVGEYEHALAKASTIVELREVVSRFPSELFGPASLAALARAEADQGNYESAADTLHVASEVARAEGDRPVADRLAKREAIHRLRIGQRESTALLSDDDAVAFIEATAQAADAEADRRAPRAWLAAGGDAQHRSAAPGDLPTPWRSWRASIAPDDPAAEIDASFTGDKPANIPSGQAIAVAGVVITPTRSGLVACSATSGKRLWTVRNNATNPLLDPARGSLATDTRLVFAVMGSNPSLSAANADRETQAVEALFSRSPTTSSTNCLKAYELATAGKLRWQLDGADLTGAAAEARFLGAPALIDSRLYALAERDHAIVLFEIDAKTGRVDWTQTLAHRERELGANNNEPAVTPTISDGIVYCPTGRGTVAAVEPLRRRISWIAYLGVDENESRPPQGRAWRGAGRFDHRRWYDDPEGWRHCRALVEAGRLVVASPAEPSLQVFDSATGDRLWRREVEDGIVLGTVTNGLVLAVEAKSVSAWRLADGEKAWSVPLPEDSKPAGEGILLEGRYLLPLTSGRLAAIVVDGPEGASLESIDLATNRLTAAPSLGNLLYHDGAILSRAKGTLESYPQQSPDPSLQEAAIAALLAGETETAIRLLREALAARPDDKRTAEQLAAALIRSVESDPSRAARVGEEIRRLVTGPKAGAYAAMLRLQAAGPSDTATIRREARLLKAGPTAEVVLQPEQGLRLIASRLAEGHRQTGRADTSQQEPPPWSETGIRFRTEWSIRQVAVQIDTQPKPTATGRKRRTRPDRPSTPRTLALPSSRIATNGPCHWKIESRSTGGAALIGANTRGERLFAEELPSDLTSNGRGTASIVGAPGHRRGDDWLAVKLDSGFVTYRLNSDAVGGVSSPGSGWAWTTDEAIATNGPAELAFANATESPVAIGPWGVVSLAGSTLLCRDLETGAPQWRRDLPDESGPSPRVLSYQDDLYVADNGDHSWRFSTWTGEQRPDSWSLPSTKSWRGESAGRLLVETRDVGGRRFQILDYTVPGPERVLWEQKVPTTTRFLLSQGLAAFLSEDLRLTIVDIAKASERFSTSLPGPAEPLVRGFRVTERSGRLLVEVDRSNPMVDRARGESPLGSKPLLTGELHCLDAESGQPFWSSPAEIDGMAVLATAATDAPVLLLGHRKAPDSEDEQAEASLALVALDLASGGTLYRNHHLPAGDEQAASPAVWAQYESTEAGQRLLIRAGRSWVSLQTTDAPSPPRVPMVARIEHPRPSDLKDVGRNVELFFKSFLNDEE